MKSLSGQPYHAVDKMGGQENLHILAHVLLQNI